MANHSNLRTDTHTVTHTQLLVHKGALFAQLDDILEKQKISGEIYYPTELCKTDHFQWAMITYLLDFKNFFLPFNPIGKGNNPSKGGGAGL